MGAALYQEATLSEEPMITFNFLPSLQDFAGLCSLCLSILKESVLVELNVLR